MPFRIRKRLLFTMILPSLTMLASFMLVHDNPLSRRAMMSEILLFSAFLLVLVLAPFVGFFPDSPAMALGTGFLYFVVFSALTYARLNEFYTGQLKAAEANRDVFLMWLPPIVIGVSIVLFIIGAVVRAKRSERYRD